MSIPRLAESSTPLNAATGPCSPGSHPHADQPNWRPAATLDDYLHNCREGLEQYSDRRVAKLLGVSRIELWRWQLMARLPKDLFERLLALGRENPKARLGTKGFAQVALALLGHAKPFDVETCPHCGGVLRIRRWINAEVWQVVENWLQEPDAASRNAEDGGAAS